MAPIVIDARDAAAPEIRGWGRYTRELVRALRAETSLGPELLALSGPRRGPGDPVRAAVAAAGSAAARGGRWFTRPTASCRWSARAPAW